MTLVLKAIVAIVAVVLGLWWLFRLRPVAVTVSDLPRQINYFLDMNDPGAALSFSRNKHSWPVRLSIARLEERTVDLTLTLYAAEKGAVIHPDVVSASQQRAAERPLILRREGVDEIVRLVVFSLGPAAGGPAERLMMRGSPLLYGTRAMTRVRDDLGTLPEDIPVFRRLYRYYERLAGGSAHEAAACFRISVELVDARAPRLPYAIRPKGTAA